MCNRNIYHKSASLKFSRKRIYIAICLVHNRGRIQVNMKLRKYEENLKKRNWLIYFHENERCLRHPVKTEVISLYICYNELSSIKNRASHTITFSRLARSESDNFASKTIMYIPHYALARVRRRPCTARIHALTRKQRVLAWGNTIDAPNASVTKNMNVPREKRLIIDRCSRCMWAPLSSEIAQFLLLMGERRSR